MGNDTVGVGRRLGTVARWPLGMSLASWRYLWRTLPVYRAEEPAGPDDAPPPLPDGVERAGVQAPDDGAGAFFHRRYSAPIAGARLSAEQVMTELADDPNRASPVEVAVFRRVSGDGPMRVGDDYVVRMPGPWDGPVRVVARTPTSVRLATLDGHLEAGQIEFRAHPDGDRVAFEIESWARSGDRFSAMLYDGLRVAKEMQFYMWTHFCERVAHIAGGHLPDGVHVSTWRANPASEVVGGGR